MLIEFTVKNFRSFRERTTLSLVASNRIVDLPSNAFESADLPGLKGHRFLKSAAIYGANASGKSNIILAIRLMKGFVLGSATLMKPDAKPPAHPFRLDPAMESVPTEFEIVFVHDGVRFRYGFSTTQERVEDEYLYSYPKGLERRLFSREFDHSTNEYVYEFGSEFSIPKAVQNAVRKNALCLSVGAQFNHAKLTHVYRWFSEKLQGLNLSAEANELAPVFTALKWEREPHMRQKLDRFLQRADLGIESVAVNFEDRSPSQLSITDSAESAQGVRTLEISFSHRSSDGTHTVIFDPEEESEGTKRLFSLFGYIDEMLAEGVCVFIDEIDASLHPHLVAELVRMVHDSKLNKTAAQLILTTHDVSLLSDDVFRRDQVWFTQKDPDGESTLIPLTDYSPRRGEALEKGYLSGRYGGVPILTEELLI